MQSIRFAANACRDFAKALQDNAENYLHAGPTNPPSVTNFYDEYAAAASVANVYSRIEQSSCLQYMHDRASIDARFKADLLLAQKIFKLAPVPRPPAS